jgi:C-terminal processing protease CtpA/Prc
MRWHKPLVGLIDEGTRSGLEVYAYALQQKGVPLVGTRTAGALLGARGYLLPDDSLLEIAVAGVELDGKVLEGKGVSPDVAVPFDLRYAAGRDPQLDAALDRAAAVAGDG